MPLRQRLLNLTIAVALWPAMSGHVESAGADVKPLVIKPRGSDSGASSDSIERLRQRLEDKLGATADPSGDRVIRVMNKAPGQAQAPHKGTSKSSESGAVLAASRLAGGEASGLAATELLSRPMAPWDYHGASAPPKWGKLDPAYGACATGKRQSPIDIRDGIQVELEPLKFDYKPSGFSVIDDGHTVQVNVEPGNFVTTMGRRYELIEFHFHRPAEEVVEGKRYDMVVHMLHRDSEGRLAMVAVLLQQGTALQAVVQAVWNNLPLEKSQALKAPVQIDPGQLLPVDQRYFTYMGSLTSPPCTEGVLWMVLRQPVEVSEQQVDIFSRLYPMNARPLQEAAGRLIKQN